MLFSSRERSEKISAAKDSSATLSVKSFRCNSLCTDVGLSISIPSFSRTRCRVSRSGCRILVDSSVCAVLIRSSLRIASEYSTSVTSPSRLPCGRSLGRTESTPRRSRYSAREAGDLREHGLLDVLWQRRREAVDIDLPRVSAFRLEKNHVPRFFREAHDLVFDGRTVPWARAPDLARVHRAPVKVFPDQPVHALVGPGQPAERLLPRQLLRPK